MPIPLPDTGARMYDYVALQNALGQENQIGFASSQIATGTNQATSLQIPGPTPLFELTTVASGTGVQLPVSSQGTRITIANNGLNPVTVYTNVNELNVNGPNTVPRIGTTAGTTGVSVTNGTNAMFHCMTPGQWYKLSGS